MIQNISYFPGQTATIFLETLDINGVRADGYLSSDGYLLPSVNRIFNPDLSLASGYPVNMIQLDVGLYYYKFIIPVGAVAVGSYLLNIAYINPSNSYINTSLYQIVVNAPFGNYGISTA